MKKKKSKRPIQRRSFLLLELIISLGLIALCLFPLIKPHLEIQKEEIAHIERLQCQREASRALIAIKEQLFEKTYTWKELASEIRGELEPISCEIGKIKRLYRRNYKITLESAKDKFSLKKSAYVLLVELELISAKKTFHFSYPLIVEGHEK